MQSRINVKSQNIRMLVAEDDAFQRLALIDILTLCNYEVVAVENGRLARDELLKEDCNFDLVLLDLMMPEMGGLELLQLMQSNDRLKDIPVIMMSADGEQEQIGECIKCGAKNYLIKPIRIQNVKNLATHIDPTKKSKSSIKGNNASLEEYQIIKLLGRGAAGSVNLVRKSTDGELFALKVIQMCFMSPQERKMAENEITLLKVLMGPTIIRYYDSFIEDECIHIVMEYAEGGSLSEKISKHKNDGIAISNEQILYWTSQLVLGIMLMHSKNILHRDIKTQNMFLTKNDVIKLGDFGISKALGTQNKMANTFLGTPYFMSPEVCNGKEYGQKSDIWSIGCAIYEMATLRRPFNHENIQGMFDMIINKDYDPLNVDVSTEVKMLIHEMLQKDPSKRPTIFEIANKPCIREKINKFVEENSDCKESVEVFFNLDNKCKILSNPNTPSISSTTTANSGNLGSGGQKGSLSKIDEKDLEVAPSPKLPPTSTSSASFPIEKLDEFSKSMKQSIPVKEIKNGYFSKISNVVSGAELYDWIEKHISSSDDAYKRKICQDLLDHEFIHSVQQSRAFTPDHFSYYIFQCDLPNQAINKTKLWHYEARKPLFVSTELIKIINNLLKEINADGSGEMELNKDFPKISKFYSKFLDAICELQKVDLKSMDRQESYAFFLNIYQIMRVHYVLYMDICMMNNSAIQGGIKTWIKALISTVPYLGYLCDKSHLFYYCINDMNFNLNDIRDGVLRGNKKSKVCTFRGFSASDKRILYVQKSDPRLVCIFSDENILPKKLIEFWKENINEKLEALSKEYLSLTVYYNVVDYELILPKSLEIYKDDIGKNNIEIAEWVLRYLKSLNRNEIIAGIKSNNIEISYPDN